MKRLVLFFVLMIFFFIASSTSMAAKWTIMVYCDADNSLDEAGVEDLNELEYSGSTEEVNMIFLLDRYGTNDTKLYYVLHDSTGTPSGSDMNIISQDISASAPWLASEEDMGNPQTLQDFVVWTIENYPADHYLLSIWDHGSGIFKALGVEITKGECWDDHGGDPDDYIDLEELRDVLAAAYAANGNQKLDIVGHDVCLLGQIETFYQMKDYVKIGIAAEESEPGDGWEYNYPFKDLINNPNLSADRLASKVVEYYCQRYGTYSYMIQAAVNLSVLESSLVPKLNTFANLLTYYMFEYQTQIENAQNNSEWYNWDCGRNPDLYHFAEQINSDNNLPDTLRAAAQDLMDCFPSIMVYECHGDFSPNAHGMSIWFPEDFLTNYCTSDYMNKMNFSQENWDEFLAEYDDPTVVYSGPVWHISLTGDDSTGDGSQVFPYRTVQKGIDRSDNGDTVLVTSGHYYERIDFKGKKVVVTSESFLDRYSNNNDSTIIDADTTVLGASDTGSVVVFVSEEDYNSVLQGFIIQNGIGTINDTLRLGGGIFCSNSSAPTIKGCTIIDNTASDGGGGICCLDNSGAIIIQCTISGNTTGNGSGGGIKTINSQVTVSDCEISENWAYHEGGGIQCVYLSPEISDCEIYGNAADYFGGGISCWSSDPLISNNTIIGNSAGSSGGAISCIEGASPDINNNIITENFAQDGGGIFCDQNCLAKIEKNVIDENTAASSGGGIFCDLNASPLVNSNIICNSLDGEGIHASDETWPTLSYNDLWNNADGNIYGGQPGVGDTTWGVNFNKTPSDSFYNIIRDPMFTDDVSYNLACSSACIDGGDPSFSVPDSGGRRADIGISEYLFALGDTKGDDTIELADVIYLANFLLKSGQAPCPFGSADVDCDGDVELADVIYLAKYLLSSGPAPGCP